MNKIITSLKYLFVMTLLTGVFYPLFITGIGRVLFPVKVEGSLVRHQGQVVGSELIGQNFKEPRYFWPRPSAIDYNPMPSGGSNLAPSSQVLLEKFKERRQYLQNSSQIKNPAQDLLFASASGLDPHISPEAAQNQIKRVAQARHFNAEQSQKLQELLNSMTEDRDFGILGEKRVNVLKLNLALDQQF